MLSLSAKAVAIINLASNPIALPGPRALVLPAHTKMGIVQTVGDHGSGSCSNARHHSSHHPHPDPAGRASALAAQRRVGLWPLWRGGGHLDHRSNSRAVGTYLAPPHSKIPA